ncbi:MAG: hypothetical protein NTZ02_00030, partial [Candidatus Woesearchaeota archaeon]|nr:hypothetical protein [Candidatus Woesearchaeota archaeon]
SKNESSIYVLATASFVFKYYAERDGINVTFITLPFPNQNFNFTTLPHFLNYEYVIYWNNAPMTFINKNSSFYEFMQNVYTNCKSDANITDSTFSEGLPKILVFNCKNVNLST